MSTYWQDKRVCVTGGAGFVGVRLVEELLDAGALVVVLDNWVRGQNRVWDAEYVNGDATKQPTLHYAFSPRWPDVWRIDKENPRAKVDVVFNLAATVAGVLHNMNHHHQMFLENVNLQVNPLAAAEELEIPVFVQVSSVCVYDTQFNHPATEFNIGPYPHPANAGYAWAKRMGERAVRWSNIDRAVIVRPSNVFGPQDYYDDRAHVIPALVKRIMEEPKVHVYGPKDVVREFIYSRDVALGMMAAAEHGKNGEAYNLGADSDPANTVTMEELVDAIMHTVGTVKEVVWHEDKGGGDPLRWSSCAKAHEELKWHHTTGLHEGLRTIIEERSGKET